MKILVNGCPQNQVSAVDRGLLFGDGLFETMGFWRRRCPLWDRHMRRLRSGCRVLGLTLPDPENLARECRAVLASDAHTVVRLTLTRGQGGRAYWPDPDAETTRIIHCRAWPTGQSVQQRKGLSAISGSVRLSVQPALSGLKHCNRLEQVLAARECQHHAVDEAVLFDQSGDLAEAVSANLLLRISGQWRSPLSEAAVAGVGLDWLLEHAPFAIERQALSRADLARADSILVINSISGIRPLHRLDQRDLVIDRDCRALQGLWNKHLIPPCDDC